MSEFIFTVERVYTWTREIKAETDEEAKKIIDAMRETDEFDEDTAQRGYLEIVDCEILK